MKNRPNIQTPIPLDQGGTAGTDASSARANLGAPSQIDLTTGLAAKQDISERGIADGYAGLDGNGNVPIEQGGTGADLSSTGGANHILKQESVGGSISVGPLSGNDIPSGIDATKVGNGDVDNAELSYLNGVTSSVQDQLNNQARDLGDLDNVNDSGVSTGAAPVYTGSSYEDKFVATLPQKGRMLWGHIQNNGSILAGSGGYTITKFGTGGYRINLSNSFSDTPAITANCIVNGRRATVSPGTNYCYIYTTNSTGSSEDNPFCFIVLGEDDPV
jgi:hypothetical protein